MIETQKEKINGIYIFCVMERVVWNVLGGKKILFIKTTRTASIKMTMFCLKTPTKFGFYSEFDYILNYKEYIFP